MLGRTRLLNPFNKLGLWDNADWSAVKTGACSARLRWNVGPQQNEQRNQNGIEQDPMAVRACHDAFLLQAIG